MKLGVFGGTFDPVHLGHLLLAERAREACGLDQVWFLPARESPFKPEGTAASEKDRVEMLRLAIAGQPDFRVSELELQRPGPSYTVDTLQEIQRLHPEVELTLLIGADSLADLPRWKEPQEILKLARVAAMNRGQTPPDLSAVVQTLGAAARSRIEVIAMPAVGISATNIRAAVCEGRSIRFQTPRSVEEFIRERKLYVGSGRVP